MSTIASIHARQILDSRGNPTVEVEVALESGAHGIAAVSTNGVLGDPDGASAEEGQRVLEAMTADVVRAVGASAS